MLYYLPEETQFQCFNSGNLISRSGFIHQRRTMDCWVLIYVLTGKLDIATAGNEYMVSGGEWIFLKSGCEHYGISPSDGELSYLWVHFKPQLPFIENASLKPDGSYILPEYGKASSQRVSILFRQLVNYSRRELYSGKITRCALELLLMEITQEYLDSQEKRNSLPPLIADITEWIHINCHRQMSVKDIAEEFHYNPEYLSALFKKETGHTLIYCVNKTRIDISKTLLSDRNVSIKEAAFSSGFNDEKYYMKMFRRFEGMTPMQYKIAIGAK